MLKALASRFEDFAPSFVAPEKNSVFEGCLSALANSEHVSELMTPQASNDNFWLPADNYYARYRPYNVVDGILIIPVKGVLLNDFPWQYGSFATGYEFIWQSLKRGMDDGSVRGVALHIHSPGGEVAGNFTLVDRIFAMRGQKPIRAFASEYAYSAAYSIASAADKIIVSRSGGVGSIGVVTSHVDMSEMMKNDGIKVTFIHFGKHKVDGNRYESLSKDVKDRIQVMIDDLGQQFVAIVARNRGIDEKAVKDTEALTFTATESVANGLADGIGPLDEALVDFGSDLSKIDNEEDDEMAVNDNTVTTAENKAAVDAARAEGHAAGREEGFSAGATSERERINAIIGSEEGKVRPKAALSFAMKSGMDATTAIALLADLNEEAPAAASVDPAVSAPAAGNTNAQNFDTAMSTTTPVVGGSDPVASKEDDADSAEGVLALAASAGIPGLRQRKSA